MARFAAALALSMASASAPASIVTLSQARSQKASFTTYSVTIHLHCRWCLGIGSAQLLNWNERRAAYAALRVALLGRDGVRLRFLGVGCRLFVGLLVVAFPKECREAF